MICRPSGSPDLSTPPGTDIAGSPARLDGTVKTSSSGNSGTFEPTGPVDFKTVTVTVNLTSPATVTVADKLPLTEFTGTGTADTGGAVDAQPVLKKSQYSCDGGMLKLSPPAGAPDTGTWTFSKA